MARGAVRGPRFSGCTSQIGYEFYDRISFSGWGYLGTAESMASAIFSMEPDVHHVAITWLLKDKDIVRVISFGAEMSAKTIAKLNGIACWGMMLTTASGTLEQRLEFERGLTEQ